MAAFSVCLANKYSTSERMGSQVRTVCELLLRLDCSICGSSVLMCTRIIYDILVGLRVSCYRVECPLLCRLFVAYLCVCVCVCVLYVMML